MCHKRVLTIKTAFTDLLPEYLCGPRWGLWECVYREAEAQGEVSGENKAGETEVPECCLWHQMTWGGDLKGGTQSSLVSPLQRSAFEDF